MTCLHYQGSELYIEDVSLNELASQYGTPCYVYSHAAIKANWQAINHAFSSFPHQICYAVKANSNLHILKLLTQLGSGFDIVSAGELARVIKAGGDAKQVVFSGVGKRQDEIEYAIKHQVGCFDVESASEIKRLSDISERLSAHINIALRINPNIDARTHTYISTGLDSNKFGIPLNEALDLAKIIKANPKLKLIGIASHIGSQITELKPFLLALDKLLVVYKNLLQLGIAINHINIGGGLGISYSTEKPPTVLEYAQAITAKLKDYPLELIVEPGRYIVANAGVLLTRVEYLKHANHKNFAIVDAGMNDLIRPALYQAFQPILPVTLKQGSSKTYDIAGPVCESADFLGIDRELVLQEGDLLAIDKTGAYGFSMSSNYNTRCRAAEVLIEGSNTKLIRRRETLDELFAAENL